MHSILFIYESESPTVSMMRAIFISIAEDTGSMVLFRNIDALQENELNLSDIVVFIRATDPVSVYLARESKKNGKFVIAYYDDDLMERPYDRPIISWRRNNVKLILEASDILLTSSSRIGKKYGGYTAKRKYVQMHTIVRPNEFRANPKVDSDSIRILYAANSSHVALVDKYIKAAIVSLGGIDKKISFNFFGVHPIFKEDDIPKNVEINYISTMPFAEYRDYMNTHDFDIGLAPLFNDDFSKCKYFNKFLEYAIFQIPGIFTNSEPYTDVVINGVNGILAENNDEDWAGKLKYLIMNKELRDKIGLNALNTVKTRFTQENILRDLLNGVPELVTHVSSNSNIKYGLPQKIEHSFFRAEESMYLVINYLKSKGFNGLLIKVKQHFGERKAFNGGSKS